MTTEAMGQLPALASRSLVVPGWASNVSSLAAQKPVDERLWVSVTDHAGFDRITKIPGRPEKPSP